MQPPRKTYSLAQGPALADGDLVTLLNTESGRDVGGEVLVALLVTGVLGDVVKVFSADDQSTVHLGGNDGAGKDTATDGDETGEGALLVCRIVSLQSSSFPINQPPNQSLPPRPVERDTTSSTC